MSFDYNPFLHVEIVTASEEGGIWLWHCHGCGGDSKTEFAGELQPLVDDYHRHLKNSHKRTPEDFAGWSKW